MARRPTIRDVAREAGVSTVTVSRVANDAGAGQGPRPASGSRRRCGASATLPNAAAQSMRTNVSRTIGFLVPDLTNYPNAAVAKAAEATLAEAGYYMLLTDSDHDAAREARFLRLLRSRQVDGIILYLSDEDDPAVQATIGELDIPVVVLDRDLPLPLDTVFSEHRDGDAPHRRASRRQGPPRARPARCPSCASGRCASAPGRFAKRPRRRPRPRRQTVVYADPRARGPEAVAQAARRTGPAERLAGRWQPPARGRLRGAAPAR